MTVHAKIFFDFWRCYTPGEFIQCWYPGCGLMAVDIMHIEPKGMGGRKSVEFIEDYCPGCRKHHIQTEGRQKDLLFGIVVEKILAYKPHHVWTEGFKQTAYYKNNIANGS